MISRIALLGVGAAAGAYATIKARRAAYRLSTPGVADQLAAWRMGAQEFRKEFEAGLQARRVKQLEHLGAHLHSVDLTELKELEEEVG